MFSKPALVASILVSSLVHGKPVARRQDTPSDRALVGLYALQEWYNEGTGLWDTMGWWNGANALTTLADFAIVQSDILDYAISVFNNTYVVAPSVNPDPGLEKTMVNGQMVVSYPADWPNHKTKKTQASNTVNASAWLDGAYDDDQWWALAWIAAYDATGNQDYLALAEGIHQAIANTWGTTCGNGGIWWDVQHNYINAIPNELFLSVSAHLANRVPDKQEYYVTWAQEEWNWFLNSGLINEANTINDGLTETCENNGQNTWSYNQGVVLGGLVELNKASPNSTYLDWATKIALGAIEALAVNNVMTEPGCDPDCEPNSTQFKGIFIRNLQLLQSVAPNDQFVAVIQASAESIWANDMNSNYQFSELWQGPFINPPNASTHSSALDALVAHITY